MTKLFSVIDALFGLAHIAFKKVVWTIVVTAILASSITAMLFVLGYSQIK